MAKASLSTNLDTIGAIIAIVLGVLLLIGTLSLDIIVGVVLIIIGALALAKRL